MEIIKILLSTVFVIYSFIFLYFAARSKKIFKMLILNAILGALIFIIINLTSKYSGVFLPINVWTVSLTSAFGAVGVLGMLVLPFIFL